MKGGAGRELWNMLPLSEQAALDPSGEKRPWVCHQALGQGSTTKCTTESSTLNCRTMCTSTRMRLASTPKYVRVPPPTENTSDSLGDMAKHPRNNDLSVTIFSVILNKGQPPVTTASNKAPRESHRIQVPTTTKVSSIIRQFVTHLVER